MHCQTKRTAKNGHFVPHMSGICGTLLSLINPKHELKCCYFTNVVETRNVIQFFILQV